MKEARLLQVIDEFICMVKYKISIAPHKLSHMEKITVKIGSVLMIQFKKAIKKKLPWNMLE